jgi:hypothetical protein
MSCFSGKALKTVEHYGESVYKNRWAEVLLPDKISVVGELYEEN